jgi:hypothetical protein
MGLLYMVTLIPLTLQRGWFLTVGVNVGCGFGLRQEQALCALKLGAGLEEIHNPWDLLGETGPLYMTVLMLEVGDR